VLPREALEIFETLFADSFVSAPEVISGRECFIMEEDDPAAKLKRMEIRGVPKGSLLLRMQRYPEPRHIFKSTKGECKRCDYIVLAPWKSGLYILYVEMKSSRLDNRDTIPQLRGADCFMTYCRALAERFHSAEISSCPFEKRFILFCVKNSNKKSIVPRTASAVHSSPENMKKFPVGNSKTGEGFAMFQDLIYSSLT
jgi:hypothetical protein